MSHKVKQTSIYIQRQISVKYEIKLFVKILILKSTIVVREFIFLQTLQNLLSYTQTFLTTIY